jgi:hypothetical protein
MFCVSPEDRKGTSLWNRLTFRIMNFKTLSWVSSKQSKKMYRAFVLLHMCVAIWICWRGEIMMYAEELEKSRNILKVLTALLYTLKTLYNMKVLLVWHVCNLGARIVQSVLLLAMGWVLRILNPSGDEIFGIHPDWLWDLHCFLCSGHQVIPGS